MDVKKTRAQTRGEEIGNLVTHCVGFGLAFVGTILLYFYAKDVLAYFSVTLYGLSLMFLYVMSSLYHAFRGGVVKRIFRRFDHISIYLLIGATYAPILLLYIGGRTGWIFFGIQWFIIAIAIALRAVLKFARLLTILSTIFYLILGWSGVLFYEIIGSNPQLFWLMLLGGVAYSVGVIFFASSFKFSHFIWHFFVLLGSILHFLGIFFFVL